MAVVSDLTIAELGAEVLDTATKNYVLAMSALPTGVAMAEFISKLLNAAYVAQSKKNAAAGATVPLVAGEALAAYSAPATGTVITDPTSGIQTFTATYSVNTVSAANLDLTVPAYV